jgi:chitodextrinase
MSFSFPKVPVRSSLSRLLPLGAAILLGSLPSLAQAGVWLTSYSFAASHPPQVYTNDSMPSWYKLRVKVLNVPNSSHGFHAANAFNNNNAILDAVPPPGTYTAELYWLKYDSTGSSLVEIGPSSSVTIVVGEPDTTPPTVPTGLAVSSYGTSSVALVWNPSSDAGGVAAYEVFRNGSSAGTVYQPAMTVGGLTSGTSTHLQVRARDVAGNWSGLSTGVMANTLVDTVAPSQPGAPTASNVTPVSATVAWSAATDNVAVAGYEVFRNGTSLGRTSALNLALTGLSASTVYQVQVRAYDGSGNASVLSGQGSFTTPALDPTVPTVPTNLTIGTVTAVSVSLSWSPSTDNISVTGYEVFRNGVSAGIVTGTTTTIGGLNPQTVYSFAVRAKDGSNNWSTLSTPATAQTWVRRLGYTGFIYNGEWFNEDTQEYEYDPTSDVHDISLTQNGDIRVFTGGSTDMRGYLDNTGNYVSSGADGGNFLIATSLAAADHTATVSGEYPSTQGGYSLYVDFRGPNLNPIANIAGGAAVGRSPMVVSFDGSASSDPDGAVAGHAWDFDNNGSTDATGPTAVATLTNTGTAPQTRTIRLTVTDLAGATGFTTVDVIVHPASSYAIGVQNGSASAPYQQVGANVSLTAAAAPSGMQFSNWALISGNGTFGNANAANTTFTIGAADTVVQAVYVPDITPPTIPIGVAISELTADSFRVSWQPASDNMGVTAYEVYRNGTLATTATSATTVVTGLSPATVYQVTVRARDAAGNRSAHSQTALTKTWVRFYSASGTIYRDEYFNEETQQWEYTISTDEFYFSIPSGTVKVHCRGGSGLWGSVSTGLWSGNFNPNSLVTGNTTPGGAVSGHITSWTGGEDYQLFFDLDPAENIAPVALFSVTPALGRAPLQVSLDGSSAYDAEGPITGYAWDLDNNGTTDATGQRASQTFANAGSAPVSATVKLTVTDLDGATAFETKTVTVYPATSFSVQVNGGTTSAPFQQAGSAVNVVASPPPHGLQFSNWTLVSGSGTFGNASLAATTFSVGSADSVVQANYVPDTTAPGAPTGLWHSEVFADAANVQWSAASDNVGVVAYEVWVNGALHSVVNSPAVALQGLTAWTPYQVAVRARDAAGNLSAMSAALGVRTWQRLYSYSGWVTNGESYDEETQTYSTTLPTIGFRSRFLLPAPPKHTRAATPIRRATSAT